MKRLTIGGLSVRVAAIAVAVGFGALLAAPAYSQVVAVDHPWVGTTGDWNAAANWTSSTLPSRAAGLTPIIANGGVAQLSVNAVNPVGGLRLGAAAAAIAPDNVTGTLEISAGALNVTNAGAGAGAGAVSIGPTGTVAGAGTLRMTGGRLDARSLEVGLNAANLIELSGNAIVDVFSNIGMGGTTRITGSGVSFEAANYNMRATSVYAPTITSNTTFSTLKTDTPSGVATIAGSINVAFSGVTPPLGATWSLFEAGAVVGNFSNSANVPVTGVPALLSGEVYRTRAVNGGAFGRKLELVHDSVLVLQVNRDTGATTILNPQGGPIKISSYNIASAAGSLKPSTWSSFTDQGTAGWQEVTSPTAGRLAEFNPTTGANFDFTSVPSKSIGTAYDDGGAFFTQGIGGLGTDLVFDYLTLGTGAIPAGEVIRGQVVYTGTGKTNSLLVTINPTTGAATLKNDSPGPITIDGFSLLSTGGSLVPGSFAGLGSPLLTSVSPTANALSQLAVNPNSPLTINGGQTFNLGAVFTPNAAQTGVSLEFTTPSPVTAIYNGVVRFEAALAGDFNNDSRVDGTDFLVWQRGGSPSPNSAGDLATWRANYGQGAAVAAASAIPEPSSVAMMGILTCCVGAFTRRRGGRLA